MKKIIKKFNFSTFSFQGHSLIEASAGTGKTYIITMLYLRLLLGVHNQHLQALPIKNILLVTFTKIATEELRIRIHNNIREFQLACIAGYSQNIFFSELLNKIDDMRVAYRRLSDAEQNMNSAQIFTIHGFCQRVLEMYPIELNSIFQYDILEDEELIFRKACNDFWRQYFYPLPIEITRIIEGYWSTPEGLFKELYPYLYNVGINIQPVIRETDIVKQHIDIINYIDNIKNMWNAKKSELLNIIDHLFLNRHIYSSKNLKNWFKKIDHWAGKKVTEDYEIPKELKRFGYRAIINNVNSQAHKILQYPLFESIEKLFIKILSLKQLIFNIAIHEIRKIVKDMKRFSSEISFNDLIYLLDDALHQPKTGKKLAQLICEHYPVAIIDEFQDTDFHQYRIFYTLYSLSSSKYGLLLIGDPKQSIYSFRGADIFSYLLARENVDFHYTLDVNWRSSKRIVNAINTLFQFNSSFPFIFRNIPFIPTKAAKDNKESYLMVEEEPYPALHFWLPSSKKMTLCEYQKVIAYQCAHTILDLLNGAHRNSVWLQNSRSKRLLQESDIVILVRDRHEGCLISSILKEFNIGTIYLSHQENIFKTREAHDVLLVLQAVLTSEDSNLLRCALMTDIIGYDAKRIDFINQNKEEWKKVVEDFINYYFLWNKYGLQSMLQEMIFQNRTLQNVSYMKEEGYLINILHLFEILQKKSMELNSESSLICWLSMKINSHGICSDDQLLGLKQFDCRLIRIITIHKAKGLEFPLVFLPFIPAQHIKKYPVFHDRANYQMNLDLHGSSENFNLSEEERLSEDLRIFYVAISRAIYYCFIGIGSVFFRKNNVKDCSDLHRTALGYLIQNGVPGNFEFLKKCLKKLVKSSNGNIVYNCIIKHQPHQLLTNEFKILNNDNDILNKESLFARDWKVSINTLHKVTSYTKLRRFNMLYFESTENFQFKNTINFEINNNESIENDSGFFTPHTFPRGNISGNFLHHIFKMWNFKDQIHDEWLMTKLNYSGIDSAWLPVVQKWINIVVNTPLDNNGLMLSRLSLENCNSELQFYLSIDNLVSAEEFDEICKNYDPVSRVSSYLKFPNIIGMLHGFIDLVFFWKGKYYLLDYKSNWLGETYNNYVFSSIQHAMIIHHYALQYQIYTLALHRFLRNKLVEYDYERDFGGVYYLFLRGVDLLYPGYGIYFCRPKKLLIDKLDQLLSFSRSII